MEVVYYIYIYIRPYFVGIFPVTYAWDDFIMTPSRLVFLGRHRHTSKTPGDRHGGIFRDFQFLMCCEKMVQGGAPQL